MSGSGFGTVAAERRVKQVQRCQEKDGGHRSLLRRRTEVTIPSYMLCNRWERKRGSIPEGRERRAPAHLKQPDRKEAEKGRKERGRERREREERGGFIYPGDPSRRNCTD